MKILATTFLLLLLSNASLAKISVITTTPDIAWLVKKVGGDRVEVQSLLDGSEDPHYVDAMPSWIAKSANADIFCQVGLELEVGWAPKVLERTGNKKILSGGKGHCDIGKFIKPLDKLTGKIDRSMGDVHAGGNPHYHLGPKQFKNAANGVFEVLVNNDPQGISDYDKNLQKTILEIDGISAKVAEILKSSKDKKIMSYHKEFSYFISDFNLHYVGEIEETPGVPPSAGRIARVALDAKRRNVDIVLASTNNPKKLLNKFSEISGVTYKQVPISIRNSGEPSSYEELLLNLAKVIAGDK